MIACIFSFAMTLAATAIAVNSCSIGVFICEFMPALAMCLPGIYCRPVIASDDIDLVRHGFQVIRIHTSRVSAKMIEFAVLWYFSLCNKQIRKAMSRNCLLINRETAISAAEASGPYPALAKMRRVFWGRSVFVDMSPESFLWMFLSIFPIAITTAKVFAFRLPVWSEFLAAIQASLNGALRTENSTLARTITGMRAELSSRLRLLLKLGFTNHTDSGYSGSTHGLSPQLVGWARSLLGEAVGPSYCTAGGQLWHS